MYRNGCFAEEKSQNESLFDEIVETVAEVFTVKFEDYKVQVIDLLKRVCTVCVRTMEIINRMPKE
ncbi:MAG TPA: hypothetical protein VGB02_01430 [Pyrinomonadaceae bacterium]|jgi:hypothetical protein